MDKHRELQEQAVNTVLTTAPARLGRLLPYLTQDTMDELFKVLAEQAEVEARAYQHPEFAEFDP